MLGFRGCRLAIRHPEIPQMQARAIFEAAVEAGRRTERAVAPEIMIPLIAYRAEFDILARIIRDVARAVEQETGTQVAYRIGTMVELPRSALKAGEIAAGADGAEFFSFGTNDLTQTTIGLSRDDAAPILSSYSAQGCSRRTPSCRSTARASAKLVRIGVDRERAPPSRAQGRHLRRARRRPRLILPRGGASSSPARRSAFPSPGSPRRRRRSTAGRPPRAPCTPDRPSPRGRRAWHLAARGDLEVLVEPMSLGPSAHSASSRL